MSRININSQLAPDNRTYTFPLYKIFRNSFNMLLKDQYDSVHLATDLDALYDEIFQDKISEFIFLIGHTGCGKSTLFKFTSNKFESTPNLALTELSLNPGRYDCLRDFMVRLTSCMLNDLHQYLRRQSLEIQRRNNAEDFKAFVINHKRYGELRVENLPDADNMDQVIESIISNNPLTGENYYPAMIVLWVEFMMEISNFRYIICIDDIEGVRYELQPEIIDYVAKIYIALTTDKTHPLTEERSSVNIHVAIRPDTYCYAQRANNVLRLDVFRHRDVEITSQNIKLSALFKARFDEATAMSAQSSADEKYRQGLDYYKNAYHLILTRLLHVFDEYNPSTGGHNCILFDLANCNYRDALDMIRQILANGPYFYRPASNDPEEDHHHFVDMLRDKALDADTVFARFFKTPADVILALTHKVGKIYSENSALPNVLKNTENPDSDLLASYIIRHFIQNHSEPVHWPDFYQKMSKLLINCNISQEVIKSDFVNIIKYFIKSGILFSSIPLYVEDFSLSPESDIKLYLMPRGLVCWNLLSISSFSLQSYREALYREVENYDYSCKRTFDLSAEDRYRDMINVVNNFVISEKVHIEIAANNHSLAEYYSMLGKKSTSRQIFEGLQAGFHQYFQAYIPTDLQTRMTELNNEMI